MENIFKSQGNLRNGIYCFSEFNNLTGENLKFAKLYNRISFLYNLSGRLFYWFKFGSERKFREDFLKYLTIKDGDLVLETSVGTGDNFRFLNKKASFYGVDISYNMLKSAKRHLKRWRIKGVLVNCEAENLPFKDEIFDVVYHCGGINFYNDKQAAINEMIRVAKPGTEIIIVDETAKTVREIYYKSSKKDFYDITKTEIPVEYIPTDMENIKTEIVCKGYMYVLMFRKPK